MSLVNIVPRHANWESRELMIAASTPAMSTPISHGLPTNWPTITPKAAFEFGTVSSPAAAKPAAQTPMRMHGSQTIAMQIG